MLKPFLEYQIKRFTCLGIIKSTTRFQSNNKINIQLINIVTVQIVDYY